MLRLISTLVVSLCLLVLPVAAQDFSNKGKEFWLTFPAHVDGTGAVMGIYITSDKAATGTVQAGTVAIPFSITANGIRRIFLGPNGDAPNTSVYLSQTEGIAAGAGIRVTSDVPVVVYAHIIRQARSGATLALPTSVWGKDYIVPSYRSAGQSGANSGYGVLTVVAKETNTVIEVTPSVTSRAGQPAGIPYTITLSNPGDVYQVQFPKDLDISGTKVRSIAGATGGCKPIAVFSATTWSAFDCPGASGGDNLFQQLFPTRSFGRTFLTAPFARKTYDIFRVFVTDATAVVRRTENGVTTTLAGLNTAGYYEFSTNQPNQIQSDKPISVVQYMTSQTCGPTGINVVQSDPEMVVLNPVEQTINNITVFSARQNWVPPGQSNVDRCYLNIIIQTAAAPSFRINGLPPTGSFQGIPGTGYSYLQEEVTNLALSNPVQTLTADSSFSAIAYGYGNVESYGYNAGTNVIDRSQFITIKNEFATVNFPATCVNSPFNFAITLPYQATQLRWQFYGRFTDTTVNAPVPDSSFVVDSKTLYQYRLPRSYILSNTGLYKVTVFATNPSPDGCSGEQQIDYDVEVFPKPTANFDWTHTGCTTDSVRFTDRSNGLGRTINRWRWQFGDGGVDSVRNPAKLYAAPGVYSVRQTIITDIGCVADTVKTINVTLPPVAKFGVSAPACIGSPISFTDSSTASGSTIVRWYWDFGNGRRDTATTNAARTNSYAAAGTYTVRLVVENQSGCRSVAFTRSVVVTAFPVADFALPAAVCLPVGRAAFTDASSIADGTQAQFKYRWEFGDGGIDSVRNPVHFYNGTGPFTVKLRVTSGAGCIKDTSKVLSNVFAQPQASFTVPAELCLRDSSRFASTSTAANQAIVKYYWNFGNGQIDSVMNPVRRYATADTFTVRHWIVSDKGCFSDTAVQQHIVNPLPTAAFNTSSPACENNAISFADASNPRVGTLTRWQWNLGDATVRDLSSGAPFTHVYSVFGPRQVSLVVTNSKGCVGDTLRRMVQINPLPRPDFVVPEVCLTDAFAVFTNNSSIPDGTGSTLSWQWNFGDAAATPANPNTSTARNAQHRYSAVGNYTVRLVVTSANGCVDSVSKVLTVNGDRPRADFVVLNDTRLCANETISIQNKSTVNFGAVTKTEIFWDWPNAAIVTTDDNPQPDKQYSHRYPDFQAPFSKAVQIRFLAYSGGVCVSEVIKTITLNASPRVVFQTIPGICLDASSRSILQASDAAGLPGAGTFSGAGVNAAGLFNPATVGVGTYTLQYRYISTVGCRDSATQTITVWPRPTANFNVDAPTCETQAITFRDASVPNFARLAQWNWTMGNGNTRNLNSANPFTEVYSSTGNYTVALQVITDSGCTSVPVSKTIRVNPLPKVDFTLPVVCMPVGLANFTDQSTIADGSQAQFTHRWSFGVGNAGATGRSVSYNYPAVGSYNVKLVVTSKDGCSDSLTKVLSDVNPQPLANFDITPPAVCIGDVQQLTDRSNPLAQTITGWFWDLGDGTRPTTQNVSYTYRSAGTFNVRMYYQTNKGCFSDTVVKPLTVHPYPVVNAGPDLVVLEGGQATINATATGSSNYTYLWTPATHLSSATVLTPVTRPTNDITYRLTVTGAGGCARSDDVFVKVLFDPVVPNGFSPNGDGINDVWNIKYISSYPGAVIQVFDRYGKQVFSSMGYNTPWDGKLNGADLPVGTYYYIIDPKNGRKARSGSVTILR